MSQKTNAVPRQRRWQKLVPIVTLAGQRLLFGALVLFAIAYLSLFGLDMAKGATLNAALGRAARRLMVYLAQVGHGDLGMSIAGSATYAAVPVAQVLPGLLVKSLGLLAVSLVVATVVGTVLGFWAARRRHTMWALLTILVSIVGVSLPSFFVALLLQLGAIRWTRAFGYALLPVGGFGWDKRIILPALVLAARPIAQIARVTSVALGEVLGQDYVRTAHSKGLSERLVIARHVIRNAAIPILTTIGLSLRFSLSSLPVVELFFNWTGVGFSLLKAIAARDDNLTLALLVSLGGVFVLVNLLLEVIYRLLDPRLRLGNAQTARERREGLLSILRAVVLGSWETIANSPLWIWLWGKQHPTSESPFRGALEQRGIKVDLDDGMYRVERRRSWMRGTVRNVPFVIGMLTVAFLGAVILFGPSWTPHSPYTKQGLEYVDGKLIVPPFAPDEVYPWGTDPLGRDIMSLVVAGAQQTLLVAAVVVSARVALGFVLGALSGWLNGTWVDRAMLGLSEIIAAFPTLLLAMTLILALGIERGLRPFVIALSVIGWGEIAQFVRSQVMTIRVRPYIESAVATGVRTPRMIWSHVLPNVLPSLVSLAALEMGAVLMLLGELGFVGIMIGGGAFAELQIDAPPYHYSDVPEWGALLSNIRLYARSYPWTALYPAAAFFVAILGFNLFGEGVRRMIETVGIRFSKILNRYTLALALVAALGVGWAKANTGGLAYYRRQASEFDGERALAIAQALADPILEGRALGSAGLDTTAALIRGQFASLGLQGGGEGMGYYQQRSRSYESLDAVPVLEVGGMGEPLRYRVDYAEYPAQERAVGQFSGPLRVVTMGQLTLVTPTYAGAFYKAFDDISLVDDVVMVLSERDAAYMERVGVGALLVVTDDASDLSRRYTLSSQDPRWAIYGTGRQQGQLTPKLWVSESAADRILEGSGYTVAELRRQAEDLAQDEVVGTATQRQVSIDVRGTVQERVPVLNVIGHLPGLSDSRYGGINSEAIVVMAQYDNPPLDPQGEPYPGANDNASGVALMMEAIRTMQETGYQPYRTFLFIAYSGEGLEGGEPVQPSDVRKFLQAHRGFVGNLDVQAIVNLRGLGNGTGDALVYSALGSRRLSGLFERSARQMGTSARPQGGGIDISIVYEEKSRWEGGQEAPEIRLNWEGWEATARQPTDTPETLSADKLERAGKAITLALMVLGREATY
ncbi:MAG: ABC transporter permease subunit [Anaerolineae bacterium]